MPINTGGYQVQVMPTYTPLDPRSVSFNPQAFSQGALSSIEIIDQLQKQKAFAQAQADLAATREGRLGATNAQNLATIQLAPQQNLADIAFAQQRAAIIPGQTEATLAGQQQALALRPFLQHVERQKAETADQLAAQRSDMEVKQAELDAQNQAYTSETAPLEHQVKLIKLNQDIESIASDKTLSDAQKVATIRNLNASAAQSEAQARKDDRAEPKKIDPIKELDDIQMQIDRLKKEPVVNPGGENAGKQMPYIQYLGETRPDGNLAQQSAAHWYNPFTYGNKIPVPLNPAAEKVADQLAVLEARRAALTAAVGAQATPSSGGSTTPPAIVIPKSSSGAREITTESEFNALKPGEPFIFNGKQGVKTK